MIIKIYCTNTPITLHHFFDRKETVPKDRVSRVRRAFDAVMKSHKSKPVGTFNANEGKTLGDASVHMRIIQIDIESNNSEICYFLSIFKFPQTVLDYAAGRRSVVLLHNRINPVKFSIYHFQLSISQKILRYRSV